MKRHGLVMSLAVCAAAGGIGSARLVADGAAPVAGKTTTFTAQGGTLTFEWDAAAWESIGIRLIARGDDEQSSPATGATFAVSPTSTLAVTSVNGRFQDFAGGSLKTQGALLVDLGSRATTIGNFVVHADASGLWSIASTLTAGGGEETVLEMSSAATDFVKGGLGVIGEVVISDGWAADLGSPEIAGQVVGRVVVDAVMVTDGLTSVEETLNGDGGVAGGIGPDVIVGDLPNTQRWGRVNNTTAYSVATTSCNIGDERLGWHSNTSDHPVIGQNMYRLKDGRFEQIGLSWLKHGFFALSGSLCTPCTDPTNGTELGVGCSDPYSSSLNGEQSNLGPRFQVNPTTGFFPYPFIGVPGCGGNVLCRRIQVRDEDLEPSLNVGAMYFVEGHYITPDDAAPTSGNEDNNASYRRVTVSESPDNTFNVANAAPTQRQKPALEAWRDTDPEVKISYVDVPGDNRFLVGYKANLLPSGLWHYEYAVQNLNADRGAGSFSVPVPTGVLVTNIGYHDIQDHSGAPYDPTVWSVTNESGMLTWTTTPYSSNPNANALRWGSLYNFRFDADAEPVNGDVTLGLFKPGATTSMQVPASVPDVALLLVSSSPPDGAIDARQPHQIDGSNPDGWQQFTLTFTNYALNIQPTDFTVEQEGGPGPAPAVIAILPVTDATITVVLSQRIAVGAWTTITHEPSGTSTRVGYLPADVNGDGTSGPLDILELVDGLNGVSLLPMWSMDVNRSGLAEPSDILRVVDLLNGAGDFVSYNGASLP